MLALLAFICFILELLKVDWEISFGILGLAFIALHLMFSLPFWPPMWTNRGTRRG